MKHYTVFLKIAKEDLNASKTLYDKGYYPQAIFYLQQSTEKAFKSLALYFDIINLNEARNRIRHDAWKILLDKFEDVLYQLSRDLENAQPLGVYQIVKNVLEECPQIKDLSFYRDQKWLFSSFEIDEGLGEYIEKARTLISRRKDIFSLSFSHDALLEIVNKINELEQLKEGFSIISPSNILENQVAKKYIDEFDEFMKNEGKDCFNREQRRNIKRMVNKALKPRILHRTIKLMREKINYLYCFLTLFYLSVLFYPHVVSSRYPDSDFNPLKEYTKKMELIKMYDDFIVRVEKILKLLPSLYRKKRKR